MPMRGQMRMRGQIGPTVHIGGVGPGDDSEDDDDIISGVREDFRKHIDDLKRACVLEVGYGGYISTPASILSFPQSPGREDDDEEEDDDELFRSIQSKYGSLSTEDSAWFGKGAHQEKNLSIVENEAEEDEEEDDEEILRSVKQLYGGGEGGGQQGLLPKVVSPLKGSNIKETQRSPSPQASSGGETGGDISFSPQGSCEAGNKPPEEVGTAIASFLPGNWIDADEDVEFGGASPAAPFEKGSMEYRDNNLIHHASAMGKASPPDNLQIVADALKKNRHCQRTLRNILSQIEGKQKENTELQKRVSTLVDFEKYCNRRFSGFFTDQANPSVKLIAIKAPALQNKSTEASEKPVNDVQTCGPPENSDVENYKILQQKVSFTYISRRWSNEERMELVKGVKQQVYEVLVRQAMDALSTEHLEEELDSLDDHMSKIGGREFTAYEIRDAVPGIDWAEVARVYVVGRTPEECRTRWMNHEDTLINKAPWTKIEDKKLLSIAQHHNFCNWEKAAQQLGSNRTPAECLTRYQRSLNASIMRSNWTPEEDCQLRAAVEEWGEDNWSTVAACLEGRNNSQCLMRWYKVLHPTKKKSGRWSVDEDKRLKWAVSVYGPKKWKQIAEHVPGRTDLQCRERWCNVLDPSIKLGEWTVEEDMNLEASVAKHGPHHWAAVANDLKIRTDNQCCRRWKTLHPEDQPAFQRTVHIRRTALAGNFQGRAKERPRLGPQDFISKATDFEVFSKRKLKARHGEGLAEIGSEVPAESLSPRKCRAARIQKRRLARGRLPSNGSIHRSPSATVTQTDNNLMQVTGPNDPTFFQQGHHSSASATVMQTDNNLMQVTGPNDPTFFHQGQGAIIIDSGEKEKPGKRGKRKAEPSAHPNDPCKRTNLGKPTPRIMISHSQKAVQDFQPTGPQISSFVDLVCSLQNFCTYSCLVAREENWPRFQEGFHVFEIQGQAAPTIEADMFDIPVCEKSAESNELLVDKGLSTNSSKQVSLDLDILEGYTLEVENEVDAQKVTKFEVDGAKCGGRWKQDEAKELQYAGEADLRPEKGIHVEMEPILEETEEVTLMNIRSSSAELSSGQEIAGGTCSRHCASPHQDGDVIGQDLVSSPRAPSASVRDEDSCQRVMNFLSDGDNPLSYEDDEVASATMAVLSWPFFHGLQELWSQGATFLRSKVCKQNAGKTEKAREKDISSILSTVVKKPRSIRPMRMRGALYSGRKALQDIRC